MFEEVKARVRITDACHNRGIQLDRQNRGLCPIHNEKTPSFTVYPESNSWFCFGCGVGGSVVDLIAALDSLPPLEAAKQLAADYGIDEKASPQERQHRVITRIDMDFVQSFVREANLVFYELCEQANIGRWVLENCPPKLKANGEITTLVIFDKYVHLLPILEYWRDSLMDALNAYDRNIKRGDNNAALEALTDILEIYNLHTKG